MALTLEEVRQIALLARLGLNDKAMHSLRKDLATVLDFFDELETFVPKATSAVSSLLPGRVRSDIPVTCPAEEREAIKKNFPLTRDNFLKVRSIFSV